MIALRQSYSHLPILDILIKQYGLFEFGFRISIPSALNTQVLTVAILVLKTHLILYRQGDWYQAGLEMTCSLLTRLPDYPRWGLTEVHNIIYSPWPARPLFIFPLNMNPPQFDYDLWNKYPDNFTMIPVDFTECNKEMGLHCIHILSGKYLRDVFIYAQDHWINHILNVPPSDETLQVLLDNVTLLNKEDARRALKWAEGAEESLDQLAQQFIIRIRRHLEPPPVKVASEGSQFGWGAESESVKESNERTSQHKPKPNSIVEKHTKSVDVDEPSENKVKRRWTEKFCCF
ncbi:hypothetical protein BT96DRAFT_503906 [Gymnopus androsaceus JB14]|uniref:Uncharacterized protein n=1 Tax=Gymnopus androsaceus JB14 TaxID=1447944 RepID=A0A6A4HZG2_9AGAR|nr:hypothetical protein BT96DRAFT_503906 [Gymnopus androsaceus JB14]